MASEVFQQIYAQVIREYHPDAGTLIDVGAKDGEIASHLASELGCRSLPVDVQLQITESARENLEPVKTDGRQLGLKPNSVDVAICNAVFEEVARVLKPDGLFILMFPNRVWPIDNHGLQPGIVWLPRPLAYRALKLLNNRAENYRRAIYPSSSLGVRRDLEQSFGCVSFESERFLNLNYEDSPRGELLKRFEQPLRLAVNTPIARSLVEATFPTPVYVAREPKADTT
jgi:SAM-dependent methyltransferase